MRRLSCPNCESRTFFPDATCLNCGTAIGYVLARDDMDFADAEGRFRCKGHAHNKCNWLVKGEGFWCEACWLELGPDSSPDDLEVNIFRLAIRRVLRQLVLADIHPDQANPPLNFSLERSTPDNNVIIGHQDGIVTLDVQEADPVTLEANRVRLGEPYRTPLGHVRHETGHWHWQAFVFSDPEKLEQFRELFGDERADYMDALKVHYDETDDGSWAGEYLSFYASAHPWEDYAESFAHVLHLSDTLETARADGFASAPYGHFAQHYRQWVELTVALNELSRSMGVIDAYPFAPSPKAVEKVKFVYDLIFETDVEDEE